MGLIIGMWGFSIFLSYVLGIWAGNRPVCRLREAKDLSDKRTVDALLERDAEREFGLAMRHEAMNYKEIADGLRMRLAQIERPARPAKKVAKARKVPVGKTMLVEGSGVFTTPTARKVAVRRRKEV